MMVLGQEVGEVKIQKPKPIGSLLVMTIQLIVNSSLRRMLMEEEDQID